MTCHDTRTCCSAWVCPGSHQGVATGWGDPVSSHQRQLTLPFGVFAGREAVCISSTPSPKKLSLFCCLWLLARAPVSGTALLGVQGTLGLHTPSKPPGKAQEHLVTQSLQVSTCSLAGSVPGTAAGAGGGFHLLFRIRSSLSSIKFLYPATVHEGALQTKS